MQGGWRGGEGGRRAEKEWREERGSEEKEIAEGVGGEGERQGREGDIRQKRGGKGKRRGGERGGNGRRDEGRGLSGQDLHVRILHYKK